MGSEGPQNATTVASGAYTASLSAVSGVKSHALPLPFTVTDYTATATTPAAVAQGQTTTSTITISPVNSYTGSINLSCDITALPGATCGLSPSGTVAIGPSAATVVATITVPANAASGTYAIVINTHDSGGMPQHSATIQLTVKPDFQITSSSGPQTILAGQTANYDLQIDPLGPSFDSPVVLACSGSPDPSSCSFSPPSLIPGTGASATMMIITIGPVGASQRSASWLLGLWLILPGILITGSAISSKSSRRYFLVVVLLMCGLIELSCGGGGGSGTTPPPSGGGGTRGTPKGTYTIVVSGTSGTLVHTMQVTLTVQ